MSEISSPPTRRASLDAVFDFAWDAGVFTAGDVIKGLELTRSTAIAAVDDLLAIGLLEELPNAREDGDYRKGRPARRFQLRAQAGVVVGLDAGHSRLVAAVADLQGTVLTQRSIEPEDGAATATTRRTAVQDAIDSALAACGKGRGDVVAVAVGVPAPVDGQGISPPHPEGFWQLMNPDLVGLIGKWAPAVRLENDATLAAAAEGAVGAAEGVAHHVTILAGTRLGAGVVADGRPVRGAHGGAGELDALFHVPGIDNPFGLGPRLVAWVQEDVAAGRIAPEHPLASGIPTPQRILAAAAAGDPAVAMAVARAGAHVARIAAIFAGLYDPERIVLAGAIAAGLEPVLAAARPELAAMTPLPAPQLLASTLGGDVVCTGAVTAALQTARERALDIWLSRPTA